MAKAAITVLKLTTVQSTISAVPTFASVDTDTGAYVDCNNIDGGRLIFIAQKTASNVAGDSLSGLTFAGGGSNANFTARSLGDLTVHGASSAQVAFGAIEFYGPIETARFKDSDGYVDVTCTNATNVASIAAIYIK